MRGDVGDMRGRARRRERLPALPEPDHSRSDHCYPASRRRRCEGALVAPRQIDAPHSTPSAIETIEPSGSTRFSRLAAAGLPTTSVTPINPIAPGFFQWRGRDSNPRDLRVMRRCASRCVQQHISMRYPDDMRTTLTLADDVAAAVERVRRERSVGLSEAVNDLVRAGLVQQRRATPFQQKTHDLGPGIDYSNIGDAIETLDGPAAR